ncbi:hypothetical protein GXP67_26440 [Rhodocytophaga rosea]|uniref:Uncharacterized protein n=2 Tax=Rhodocytophaga rosea TaxID=2704465 RepID=A0A6C0GW98_9BACT|nr:hypothetical protein GXP67_26440 [Rhodocytophaga rosea]
MGIKDIIKGAKQAAQLLTGEQSKDTRFSSKQTYIDEQTAAQAFEKAKEKLFRVEAWSAISALSSTFTLHDTSGKRKKDQPVQSGDYICIQLPGPLPENWVQVQHVHTDGKEASFTVKPSQSPHEKESPQEVKHFFTAEASSTFQIIKEGNTLTASEIGKDEVVNNQAEEAGDRQVVNTLVAAGGWAGFQKIQWQLVTDYLVDK